jgi:flavin-binding protein dodecin
MLELVGSSTVSTDDAIQNAIAQAAKSVKLMEWFEVLETRGHIEDGKVGHFQVTIKVGFRIDNS